MTGQHVTVLGAGVAGLTCAVALAERCHLVEVMAQDLEGIASDTAASMWALPLVEQSERVRDWALHTRSRLRAERSDAAGIRALTIATIAVEEFAPDPWMSRFLPRRGLRSGAELPAPYTFGSLAETLLVDTSRYLPWLRARLMQLRGTLTQRSIRSVNDVPGRGPVIVAAGSGSGRIVDDDAVSERATTVVRVENPGIVEATVVRDGPLAPLFIVPRYGDVILGGGADNEPPPRTVARAALVEPRLLGAPIVSVARGARPMRDSIRVEIDPTASRDRTVVCCYGHGGAGYATCWGTARSVVELVETL